MFKFVAPLALLPLALASAPALAVAAEAPSISVDYSDLDLSSEGGRKALDQRIRSAAKRLCPAVVPTGSRIPMKNKCLEDAMASVRAQLAAKGVAGVDTASR